MSDDGASAATTGLVEKTKLEKGSEDYRLFHSLIQTVPEFLSLTAVKIKQRFPQFASYSTAILNTSIQNAKRTQKRREAAAKRAKKKESGEEPAAASEMEKSKWSRKNSQMNEMELTNFFFCCFYLVRGLPFPTPTAAPPCATATIINNETNDEKKASATTINNCETSVAKPTSRTCGMSHLVTNWTDTRGNDRVSVAMILPSGVNPRKPDTVILQVSKCGSWLSLKLKVDISLTDAYQCFHSYLTKPPFEIHPMALNYHGKICAHKRIITELQNKSSGEELWDTHNIYLGKVCRRTLAQPSDGDTIFYGSTCVGPRKNGTMILHVELVAEETAKRLTKRPKVGKATDWYTHTEPDGEKFEVQEENQETEYEMEKGRENDSENETSQKPGKKKNQSREKETNTQITSVNVTEEDTEIPPPQK